MLVATKIVLKPNGTFTVKGKYNGHALECHPNRFLRFTLTEYNVATIEDARQLCENFNVYHNFDTPKKRLKDLV